MSADSFPGSTSRISRQMLSACIGSFKSRYRSARSSAAGMAAGLSTLSANSVSWIASDISTLLRFEDPEQSPDRIVEFVHYSFFKGNDGVVCDFDAFRTDSCTTLCDVAVPETVCFGQFVDSILDVERMHLERSYIHKETWPNEFVMQLMFT